MNNIPVEVFLSTLVNEYDSTLDVREGTAIYEMLIKPAAILFQRFRDDLDTFKRDLSLANYNVMDPTMLDALGANYFVYRQAGTKATGLQRIYFRTPIDVTISTTVVFSTASQLQYKPAAPVTVTKEAMAAAYDYQTGLYYVDVTAEALYNGSDYNTEAATVINISGLSSASRTTNITAYTASSDPETPQDFYDRIVQSITNRDLVSRQAISTVIPQMVSNIKSLSVIGYGDPEMTSDVITVAANLQELYPPIPGEFITAWLKEDGSYTTDEETPYGTIGVLRIDPSMGIDFTQLDVPNVGVVRVDPGWKILFDDAQNRSHGYYVITSVSATELLLNAPPEAAGTFEFSVYGWTRHDTYHIGGKADIYVDAPVVTYTITIGYLDALTIDIHQNENVGPDSIPRFTNGAWVFPVCRIQSIAEVSSTIGTPVVATLEEDRWSLILGREHGLSSDYIAFSPHPGETYIGKSFLVTYTAMPDAATAQTFMESDAADVTVTTTVYPAKQVLINVVADGDPNASSLIYDLIAAKHIGEDVTAAEIHAALALNGITDINYPLVISAVRIDSGGHYTITSSGSVISIERTEIAVPGSISIE